MEIYPANQAERRRQLFAAHRRTLEYWDEEGNFVWPRNPKGQGSYRAVLWNCLAFLAGDAQSIERANRIILRNWTQKPCHFTPSASLDILLAYRARLEPETAAALEKYLRLNLPYMWTEDLKIHGYNDNHVYKAAHALILGGEMLGDPHLSERGLDKLRDAAEVFQRCGFPCEYNSPTYSPVSLQPLAGIAEHSQSAEARALALRLERFYWQDVALHFDGRTGLPAGPMSRAYVNDYSGLVSNVVQLLEHLFPERFDFDATAEMFEKGLESPLFDRAFNDNFPFLQAHPIWLASANYHLTPQLETLIFDDKPAGASVRGVTETGSSSFGWPDEDKPRDAPARHRMGPRNSLITTYFGEGFSLGTAQHPWLDTGESFYATVAKGARRHPADAAVYYSRMFFDDNTPYGENPKLTNFFREQGEVRTVQHEKTALVFYNPRPHQGTFQQLRTGIFRPLQFNRPQEVFVGETPVPHLNFVSDQMAPIAINEGAVFIGIIPLRPNHLGQAKMGDLRLHTYAGHLAIQMSSFEAWQPRAFSYDEIIGVNAGFAWEMRAASEFESFAHFRRWLAQAQISDLWQNEMRTVCYRQGSLKLAASYSPYQSAFRFVSVNNRALEKPVLAVRNLENPGYDWVSEAETF